MNTYIVRIYRRDARNPELIVGRVENAENGETTTFHTLAELMRLFNGMNAGIEEPRRVAESR
ncbi:MAG: hypothetical protein ACYC18_11800 [Gammaproteobacteria bacterium]|nr:hypothetical protein [Gammaproteobacteria bacterium]